MNGYVTREEYNLVVQRLDVLTDGLSACKDLLGTLMEQLDAHSEILHDIAEYLNDL